MGIFIHLCRPSRLMQNPSHVGYPNHRQSIACWSRACRSFHEDLAARAHLSRRTLSKWEGSSNAAVDAMVAHLSRALDVLEAEGIRFSDNGVHLQRSTVLPSDERPGRPAVLNNGAVA
jgi:transcriptional regulator with XRE-family HTH domain